MGFVLDKTVSSNKGAVLPIEAVRDRIVDGEEIIAQFFSTFDDQDYGVVITDFEESGDWYTFTVSDTQVPNRSGKYRVEFHTTDQGGTPLNQLFQPFNTITSPLNNLDTFRKALKVAETVADIKNATNALFKSQGRTIAYKDFSRSKTFKSQSRTSEYKTKV